MPQVQDNPTCVRCKEPITTGHAYELGGDRWHTHCFSCHKCTKPLSCESDFLVLGTGALICFSCSDSCKSCGKKIDDLAIILSSSNEAYCSDCFKCCKCGDKITDLRYAKTKRGLFCISCHERLLAKRKYYEEKKRRLKKELPNVPSEESLVPQEIRPQELSVPQRSAQRSSQRPLSPIVRSESTKTLDQSAIKDSFNSTGSSLAAPVDFSATTTATTTTPILSGPGNRSSMLKSNSASVVAQFLDYDENEERSTEERPLSKDIDIVLQSTLENDDGDLKPSNRRSTDSRKLLLNRTPLRNTADDSLQKSPIAHRRGMVLNDNDVLGALNSPIKMGHQEDGSSEEQTGLGISVSADSTQSLEDSGEHVMIDNSLALSSSLSLPDDIDDEDTLGISYDSMPIVNNTSKDNGSNYTDDNHNGNASGIVRSPSLFGHHRRTSSGNNKKLGRSLSMKSKSLMMNLRSKTSTKSTPTKGDMDTHSGWGVASSLTNTPQSRPRQGSSRGQSDSTLYSQLAHHEQQDLSHKRSQSGTNGNVSIYRTPPVSSHSSFIRGSSNVAHERSLSIGKQVIDEDEDDKTPTNADFIQQDITDSELTLRKLKLEINELDSTKARLSSEVESLKLAKSVLLQEISTLKNEKKSSSRTSLESFEPDLYGESPGRQGTASASLATTGKPRFWKLFSSNKPNSNPNSATTPPSSFNSQGKIEISAPVLQNPGEFDDMKLLPIMNSESSESSSQQSKDGPILYGSTLVARCAYENSAVPMIMKTCIKHIESQEEFLLSEGIYRKSGSQLLIEQIEGKFAAWAPGCHIGDEIKELLEQDIHAVTSVLKRYLRKLPNPVLTFQIYESLMSLVRDNRMVTNLPLNGAIDRSSLNYQVAVERLGKVLSGIPKEHFELLQMLVRHIDTVARYSDSNLMNLNNLALVFAPGLIRDYSGERDIIDIKERNYVIGFILTHHEDIFA